MNPNATLTEAQVRATLQRFLDEDTPAEEVHKTLRGWCGRKEWDALKKVAKTWTLWKEILKKYAAGVIAVDDKELGR